MNNLSEELSTVMHSCSRIEFGTDIHRVLYFSTTHPDFLVDEIMFRDLTNIFDLERILARKIDEIL